MISKIKPIILLSLLALILAVSCGQKVTYEPPVAKVEPVVDTLFGHVMTDNYHWLRDDSRSETQVLNYLEAENAYADSILKPTLVLQDKMYNEMKSRIKETDLSVPYRKGNYFYYSRTEEGKQYDIYCRKQASLDAPEEVILDVNQLAEGKEFMSVGVREISPNAKLLAYATDESGNERYTLRVKNLETGTLYPDVIDKISTDVVWAADNKTLFYTIPDDAWRPYRVYRHKLGDNPVNDKLIYQEDDESFWVGLGTTKDDQYIMMSLGNQTTSEWRYLKADNPIGQFQMIQTRITDIEYSVEHHSDKFYIVTNDNALNFKLVTAPVNKPGRENWTDLIPHRPAIKLDGIDMYADYIVLYERENGLTQLAVHPFNAPEYRIDFPEPVFAVYSQANPEFKTELTRFSYMSLTTPSSIYDFNMKTKERELKKQKEVLGGYNPNDYQSERIMATADDGTKVPISMVYKKGMVKDGKNPLYLYAYGAYGISMDPWFSSNRLSLLDRGFIFAIAHIRGGGEMGRQWYDDGKMFNKRNTFTDFIACGRYLVSEKYTSHDKMVISGGSAGGLLIGAVVNMAPDLAKIATTGVPFVDVINTMMDESIPLTVIEYTEWGNPNIEEQFEYMLSYSPYDNIEQKDYPYMYIEGSLNDTRVGYWEPAKWAAKLRATKTDHNPLLLITNMGAGHGGSSGRYDYLHEIAREYAYVCEVLGINK